MSELCKTMNNIIKLSSTIVTKLITVLVCGLLLVNAVIPLRNLEIRSFFVSIDMIQRDPVLLEVVTASRLNEIILESFLCDFGVNGESGVPVKGNNDSKGSSAASARCSMAMVGNATHLILAGLSQDLDRKAQLDNTVSYKTVLYSVNQGI